MLSVKDLRCRYGSTQVLRGVSFDALPGEMTIVIGPNGAGKSTMLRCAAGLERSTGEVDFCGESVAGMSFARRSELVGFLDQDTSTRAALTVIEVMLLARPRAIGARASSDELEEAERALDDFGLLHLASRRMTELSGGQRQSVFIAQTLMKSPKLLMLDEPISALDLRHQFDTLDRVRELTRREGMTTLVTLHHLDMAAHYADRVAVLDDGGLYSCGSARDVFSEEMFRDVYGVRARVIVRHDAVHVIPYGVAR